MQSYFQFHERPTVLNPVAKFSAGDYFQTQIRIRESDIKSALHKFRFHGMREKSNDFACES